MAMTYGEHIQSVIYLLYFGITLVFLGLSYFQITRRSNLSIAFIAAGSLSIGLFLNLSDPFLHTWDEQFHAVVAKNMLTNPFKPTLLADPIFPYHFRNWTGNHIWLHKQPWFLWQIALFFKVFGTSIISLRLPSIFMTSALVFPIFRIGKMISGKQTGITAAVLFTGSNFVYQLASGRIATDHNDIAFLFYVTLSIWAWFEKEHSKKKYWLILIGLFSGIAILNKWLAGLLVYAGWGLVILFFSDSRKRKKRFTEMGLSLVMTAVIAIPWQVYILIAFPKESLYEYQLNTLHFFEVIEGHVGGFFYHINHIPELYGTDFQYVILASVFIFLFSKVKNKYKFVLLLWMVIIYLFYSIAVTKMTAFTIVIAPLVYVMVATGLDNILRWTEQNIPTGKLKLTLAKTIRIAVVFFVFLHFLNHDRLSLKNSQWEFEKYELTYRLTDVYKELHEHFSGENVIIYNSRNFDMCKIMFTTNMQAMRGTPTESDVEILREKNISIVIFDDNELPGYIIYDSSIAKVKSPIWSENFEEELEIYY